jgi:hypothetical protein
MPRPVSFRTSARSRDKHPKVRCRGQYGPTPIATVSMKNRTSRHRLLEAGSLYGRVRIGGMLGRVSFQKRFLFWAVRI